MVLWVKAGFVIFKHYYLLGIYVINGYNIRKDKTIMKHAKSICRSTNCGALIPSPGYCDIHKDKELDRFKGLRKAPGSRAFYGSGKWTKTARAFRQRNPLCNDHARRGLVVKGDLVDHTIERNELIAKGLDPYSFEYLQTLCHSCHNRKLRTRQRVNKGVYCGAI